MEVDGSAEAVPVPWPQAVLHWMIESMPSKRGADAHARSIAFGTPYGCALLNIRATRFMATRRPRIAHEYQPLVAGASVRSGTSHTGMASSLQMPAQSRLRSTVHRLLEPGVGGGQARVPNRSSHRWRVLAGLLSPLAPQKLVRLLTHRIHSTVATCPSSNPDEARPQQHMEANLGDVPRIVELREQGGSAAARQAGRFQARKGDTRGQS